MKRWIWGTLFLCFQLWAAAGTGTEQQGSATIFPEMDHASIMQILQAAGPGDTILFSAGTYRGNYRLENLHGKNNLPIVIRGEAADACIIDGESNPGMSLKNNAFKLTDCSWINIENFTIQNCWTDLIVAENSSWISLRYCLLYGGKRALFASGRGSHHFLVERSQWEQEERVWSHEGDYSWDEVHHGIHRHYNGSLFQGSGISGNFVLRDNLIKNTFNAFRLSQINDGSKDLLACTNGEIYRNTIQNTSDNVLEPEVHVRNLHFYHNTMINGHAFVSITEVLGGDVYIYGNTAMSLPESEDGWTIFKISCNRDSLSHPLYIFNNSWQVDFDMIGSPRNVWENSHVHHFNNACFSEASDTFGIYNLGLDNHFDYDCSNVPFPNLLLSAGHEKHGLVADPLFRNTKVMDFRLQENSPCIDRGKKDDLILAREGKRPDIGAYDGEQRIEGLPFRYMEPEVIVPCDELPRITRMNVDENEVQLWFSLPMDASSLEEAGFSISNGALELPPELPLDHKNLSKDGYLLRLSVKGLAELKPSERSSLTLTVNKWPRSQSGQSLTSWASETDITLARGQESALETTRRIADKVIRETSFEYELRPMTYNAGIIRFTLDRDASMDQDASMDRDAYGPSESVTYARAVLQADEETQGYLGLAFAGELALFLNGEELFRGSSAAVELKEYTYNRYRFGEKIPVLWKKGENTLLVKCATGKKAAAVVVLPVNEMDEKLLQVNALPATTETVNSHWLTCGPWIPSPESWTTEATNGMKEVFPPEEAFHDHHMAGQKVMAWQLEEVPLLRQLVVAETNSYTRDPYADWHYANGGTMLAILSLHQATGDPVYLDFVKNFAANILENDDYFRWQYFKLQAMRGSLHRLSRMTMLDDSGGPVLPLAELQRMDRESELYLPLLERNFKYVMKGQERLEDLTFSRPEPRPATVWADDLFMSVPFLLRMAEIREDPKLYDEVARQVIRFNQYLADPESGLYFHGWYDQQQENTPVRWGRANGWIIWATSEALLHLPEKHPSYKKILKIYRRHMEAIASVQAPSGMWHQVLDHTETWEETSCTAMFALGMARGARMGWLKKAYGEKALKAWDALQNKIQEDGTVVDICRGTGIGDDVDFYAGRKRFDHDPRGLGAMITAGCEISLLREFTPSGR